jgi:nucleoside-diphosphate-sugar epimerase
LRITVLGAAGFVGSHLVDHLLKRSEHEVVGVDLDRAKLSHLAPTAFEFHRADIRRDRDLVEDLVRRSDTVVDLVAYANPSLYVTSPLEVFQLNFVCNLEIAELCILHGKRLIQYSSSEVYGKAMGDEPFSETTSDMVLGPVHKQRWIYAASKSLLERLLYAHGTTGALDYTIVRPFNFIGSRIDYLVPAGSMGGPRVFAHFMSALLQGGPIFLVDGGRAQRSFLHIRDATEAFQTLIDRFEASRNQIYNFGNPANNVTIRELAILMKDLYEELTGVRSSCELVEVSGEKFYGVGYEDANRLPPDISKLRALGWAPRFDLRHTLRDAMAYYLECDRALPLDRSGG